MLLRVIYGVRSRYSRFTSAISPRTIRRTPNVASCPYVASYVAAAIPKSPVFLHFLDVLRHMSATYPRRLRPHPRSLGGTTPEQPHGSCELDICCHRGGS